MKTGIRNQDIYTNDVKKGRAMKKAREHRSEIAVCIWNGGASKSRHCESTGPAAPERRAQGAQVKANQRAAL